MSNNQNAVAACCTCTWPVVNTRAQFGDFLETHQQDVKDKGNEQQDKHLRKWSPDFFKRVFYRCLSKIRVNNGRRDLELVF